MSFAVMATEWIHQKHRELTEQGINHSYGLIEDEGWQISGPGFYYVGPDLDAEEWDRQYLAWQGHPYDCPWSDCKRHYPQQVA